MKKRRLIASILAATLIASTLSGCGDKDNEGDKPTITGTPDAPDFSNKTDKTDDNKGDTTTIIEVPPASKPTDKTESKPSDDKQGGLELDDTEKVAYNFARAIQTKDLKTIREMLPYSDTTFITDADLEWLFFRTDYADAFGKDEAITSKNTDSEGYENKTVVFKTASDKKIPVSLKLKDDNSWGVALETENIAENYTINLPRGTATYNGIALDEKYLGTSDNNALADYVLPVVVCKPVEVSIDLGGSYGVKTLQINGGKDEKPTFALELSVDESNKFVTALENRLNALFAEYIDSCEKNSVFDFTKYISSAQTEQGKAELERQIKEMYRGKPGKHQTDTIEITGLSDRWNDDTPIEPFSICGMTKDGNLVYRANFNAVRRSSGLAAYTTDKKSGVLWIEITVNDNQIMLYRSPATGAINSWGTT